MPRLFKLIWISLALSWFLSTGPVFALGWGNDDGCSSCGASCKGCKHEKEPPIVTWYVPAPPYPVYFGPPYPYTSYMQVHYVTPPAESALIVKQRLMFINSELMVNPPLVPPGGVQTQDPTHGNAPNTHGNAPAPAPQPSILPPPSDFKPPME